MEMTDNKKPFGFYVCCIVFMLERMAYYSAKYLVYAFVGAALISGGLGYTVKEAAIIQGNLVAFTYLAPIICGPIADRWIGPRYLVPVGLLIMAVGYYGMGQAAGAEDSLLFMNAMVIVVALGTGFFKGNVSGINGHIIGDEKKMDSAFSTQYSFVNAGSFIGTTVIGILLGGILLTGDVTAYDTAFSLCAIVCIIAAVWFVFGYRFLGEHGKKPFKYSKIGQEEVKAEVEDKPLTKAEKKRVTAIVLISLASIVFWVFWYLSYMAVYEYFQYVDATIGTFVVPDVWFDSLNAACCIILGPLLGMLWFKMAQRPQGDISLFKKLALGLSFLGLSFVTLIGAELTRNGDLASLWWIILFGVLLSLGEMFFSPLGNSFVSKFAPAKYLSILMGVWIIATFFAAKIYGPLFGWMIEKVGEGHFYGVVLMVPAITFVIAILLFAFDNKLVKLLNDDSKE